MSNQVDVNDRHVRYTATAGQTVFDYDFPLDDAGNIAVYINGVLEDPANYTVDLDAQTVTLNTGATLADDITIDGLAVLERATGYPIAGGLRASLLNGDQNKVMEVLQELRRDSDTALRLAKNAAADISAELPAANPGKALKWSDDGKSIVNTTDDIDGIVAAAEAAQAAAETAQSGAETSAGTASSAASTASGASTTAIAAATAASDAATTASAAATTATNAIANLSATSTSSVAIGTGSKSFTIAAGKFFTVGQQLQVASAADPANYMHGPVTAYSDTTLTIDVTDIGGSGTKSDWNIAIAGTQGTQGAGGDQGEAGAPGSAWFTGSGAPSDATGADGDLYLNTANGDVYKKASGTWGSPAANITGPSGDASGGLLAANNLSDLASASTARTNLGLGTMATQAASAIAITGGTITGLGTPSGTSDAATKGYVDGLAAGLSGRTSCRVATTANLTSAYSNGTSGVGATLTNSSTKAALSIDGKSLALNERVLVKNQTTAAQNGIYTVTTVGDGSTNWVLTRATDFDAAGATEIVEGAYTLIEEGTVNTGFLFLMTQSAAITVGTTSINWTQLAVTAPAASSLTGTSLASGVVSSSLTSVGTITSGVWHGTAVDETHGGTNQTTYAKGDILYASAANTLSKLAAGTDGNVLTLASGIPSWGGGAATLASANGLTVKNNATTPNTKVDISATAAILTKSDGSPHLASAPSVTVDCGSTGANGLDTGTLAANTWYYAYLIYNGTTVAGLMSLSSTAPTLPSGYTYSMRVGAMLTDASSHFIATLQKGRRTQYAASQIMSSGVNGNYSTPTFVAVTVNPTYVPPTAVSIIGGLHDDSGSTNAIAAPNASYGGGLATSNIPPAYISGFGSVFFEFLLEATTIQWAASTSTCYLLAFGWTDAVNAT